MTVPRLKSPNRVRNYRQNPKRCSSRHQKKHQRNPYIAASFCKITLAEPDSTDMEQLSRISEGLDRIVQDVSQRERHDKKFFIHPEISKYLVGGPFPGINYVNQKRLGPTEEHPNAAFFKKNGKVYKVTTDVASIKRR
jgi:hypothetical protein